MTLNGQASMGDLIRPARRRGKTRGVASRA
jgi:hypothetical protein